MRDVPSVKRSGFTLLELSIVLIIIAMVTGMGLFAGMGAIEAAKKTQTENKMAAIQTALMEYRNRYNRVPCPGDFLLPQSDVSYGLEAANAGVCTGGTPAANFSSAPMVEGNVPVRTLGLPNEYMYDGWGRQFAYWVDTEATAVDAFITIKTNESCRAIVWDAAGYYRTGNVAGESTPGGIYALISYGKNGHGGYTANGSIINAGSTNAHEQVNCHCNASAVKAVMNSVLIQKDPTENSASATDSFDDIIRFATRWQMQNANDYAVPPVELQLALGHAGYVAATGVPMYRKSCGRWITRTTPVTVPYGTIASVAFTADNRYLFAYSDASPYCQLFRITGATLTYIGDPMLPASSCPTYAAGNLTALSDNGYLAVTSTVAPYIRLAKHSGNNFLTLPLTSLNPALTARPEIVAWSRNADYLFLSDRSTYSTLYVRMSDTSYIDITLLPASIKRVPPTLLAPGDTRSAAFSPDGKYLAIAGTFPDVTVWRHDGHDIFTQAASFAIGLSGTPDVLTFSQDSVYMAVAGGATANIGDNVLLYKIDTPDVFTPVTLNGSYAGGAKTPVAIGFTPDTTRLIVATNDANGVVNFLERISPLVFTPEAGLTTVIAKPVRTLAVYH